MCGSRENKPPGSLSAAGGGGRADACRPGQSLTRNGTGRRAAGQLPAAGSAPSGSAELGVRVGVGDLGAVNPHAVVRGCAHDLGLKGNAQALCVANDIPAKIRNKGQVSRRLAGTGCYQGSPREGESKSLPLLPLTAVPRLPACRLENCRL